ncbi:MAG: sigma-70 family RNA polymerase sigma factor [Solirubrobacterales bacterium]|nr:sigma-70 family RNA polymerase sigma factor [Solirubrobacterales bacterium]
MSPRLSDLLLSSQSDERLVSLARAGHERAFAAIVERYRPELQAMARRLCRDERSEDIVQQAFLSAFAALRSGSEVRHLRGWLYQILRNAAGRPQAPPCLPLDQATASAETVEEIVQRRALARAALSEIARLPARQRQAMIGTALDGRGRAEVASSMGLSEGAVRQLVHRARTTLRGAVTALTPWPLARWIAAVGPDAPGPGELAAGAGAASSGGLALKLGALLASGTILTGAAVQLHHTGHHRSAAARAEASVQARPAMTRARATIVAAVAPAGLTRAEPVRWPVPGADRTVARSGTRGLEPARYSARHEAPSDRSRGRDDGQRTGRRDAGGRERSAGAESGDRTERSDGGDASARSSGSDDGSHAGHGSDGGEMQMASESHGLRPGGEDSAARHDSGSGSADRGDGGGSSGD